VVDGNPLGNQHSFFGAAFPADDGTDYYGLLETVFIGNCSRASNHGLEQTNRNENEKKQNGK
jgi:hypothetical protein